MKRISALLIALITLLTFAACSKDATETTAPTASQSNKRDFIECAIDFPTLLENGGLQYGSSMEAYHGVTTLEDILKGGINGKTTTTFDEEGNLIELGGIEAKNGSRFIYSTFNEQNRFEILDKKPSEIELRDYASYAIKLVDENGIEISYID